jgi:heptaprenylglyceryl phosphate synthase
MANTMMNYPYTPQESSNWFQHQQHHQHQAAAVVQQQAAQQASMMMPVTNPTSAVASFGNGNRTPMAHPHAMSHHHLNHSAFTASMYGWY